MKTNSTTDKSGHSDIPIHFIPEKIKKFEGKIILVKYGGNAMTDESIKQRVIQDIVLLKKNGAVPVIVHGGGIVIKNLLDDVGIQSEFIGGHRVTDVRAMSYVEMALSGSVNSDVVKILNYNGVKAVGISGKDANTVTARRRVHRITIDGKPVEADLGQVGDVDQINTDLIETLIVAGYTPVVSPVASGSDLLDYNINADMFAGHMAGALKAEAYIALTNVDGILSDVNNPDSLIHTIKSDEMKAKIGTEIQGGMIPKIESCLIALENGVKEAHIINGTTPHTILKQLFSESPPGTIIEKPDI
ncbi:MAG: acetylglutamate kinase [Balneolaceae bacterium]